MKASLLYRIAAALLLLFTVGHALGFQQSDPSWGIGPVLAAMQSTHFSIQGFTRTYWDFYLGAGFTVGVLYLLAAVLAWQLGGLPKTTLGQMRAVAWGFACCFGVVTGLSWRYLFWIPIVMSGGITMCLGAAAWLSRSHASATAAKAEGSSHAGAA